MVRPLAHAPTQERLDALPPSELLLALPAEVRAELDARLTWVELHAGEAVWEDGQPGDAMYRVVSGRLEVHRVGKSGVRKKVADLCPGDWLGELAIVSGDVRRSTVIARRDTVLARLDVDDLQALEDAHPSFTTALARYSVRQLVVPRPPQQRTRVLAIAPISRGAAVDAFAQALGDALRTWHDVRIVGRREAEAAGPDDVEDRNDHRIDRWLDTQEARADVLLVVAEERDTPWTRAVLRNADRVLLVAPASGTPLPWRPHHRPPRTDLVLLQAEYARTPRGTAGWLDRLDVQGHHHVRLGRAADVERVARFVSGRAVGLALGGGAGRGIAHLGVFQALEEHGIPVDIVTGTSMGAILGAQLAQGHSVDEILPRARMGWTSSSLFDLTVPFVSLTTGRLLKRNIRRAFGNGLIEDTWLPFGCVSTSLTQAEAVTHLRGRLVDAILASSTLPGLVPPMRWGDDLLVDGAFVDNLPEQLARDLGAGTTIAVNVMSGIDPVFSRPRRKGLANKARGLNPFSADRQPMIHDIIHRSYFVPTILQTDEVRARADVFIEPPLTSYGVADRRKQTFDAIHAAGYHETLRVLRQLRVSEQPLPGS